MAAKKRRSDVWKDFNRFDHATVLTSPQVQERATQAITFLGKNRLVRDLLPLLECERGEWLRVGHAWSKPARVHAKHSFERASFLEDLVRLQWGIEGAPSSDSTMDSMRVRFWEVLKQTLDMVAPAPELSMTESEALAGLSGMSKSLSLLRSTSALSAVATLATCIRRAVIGMPHPFWPYLDDGAAKRSRGANSARSRPRDAGELEVDEVAVLRICANAGRPLLAKEVALASEDLACSFGVSHWNRRKKELVEWGLLERDRHFALSSKGRAWLVTAEKSSG
jgi:hypothetical protein